MGDRTRVPGENRPSHRHGRSVFPVSIDGRPRQVRRNDGHENGRDDGRGPGGERGTRQSAGQRVPQPDQTSHHEDDERHQREIHPPLGSDFCRNRDNAGRRSEGDPEPGSHEAQLRPPPQRQRCQDEQRGDDQRLAPDIRERQLARPSVQEHQRSRPGALLQIPNDRGSLIQQVRPGTDARREPRRMRTRPGREQENQQNPGGDEAYIEVATRAPGVPERREQEHAIEQRHHDGGGRHRFLAGHARGARQDRDAMPSSRRPGRHRARKHA